MKTSKWLLRILAGVVTACSVVGCQTPLAIDPNDPNQAGAGQAEVLQKDVKVASDTINDRVVHGTLTIDQGKQALSEYAAQLLSKTNIESVPDSEAWKYADVMITAKEWAPAEDMLKLALKNPPNWDRRVNDTLRMAHCEAELGHVDNSIALTRQTFSAPTDWKWPILYATYLEIVPAALKTAPKESLKLARLVEDAIHQHEIATGDPKNPTYTGWFESRKIQIVRAWGLINEIYRKANRVDLAKEAERRAREVVHVAQV